MQFSPQKIKFFICVIFFICAVFSPKDQVPAAVLGCAKGTEPLSTHELQRMFCGQTLLRRGTTPFSMYKLTAWISKGQIFEVSSAFPKDWNENSSRACPCSPSARRTCGWCNPPERCNPPQTLGYSRRSSSPGQASTGNTSPAQKHGNLRTKRKEFYHPDCAFAAGHSIIESREGEQSCECRAPHLAQL